MMNTSLPSNEALEAFSEAVPWREIDDQKQRFNARIAELSTGTSNDELPLDALSDAVGVPLTTVRKTSDKGNIILAEVNGRQHMLGSFVSERYRKGKSILQSISPYNLNPAVNHTNLPETDHPINEMRALGAELELGLFRRDGSPPTEEEMQTFITSYRHQARRLGVTPQVDREACQFQVEVHIAPGVGYHRTRQSLDGILYALTAASEGIGLQTAILSCFPLLSDFLSTPDPKVETAVDAMEEINSHFSVYMQRKQAAVERYHMNTDSQFVQVFRLQGCHIHLDIAGRSEALGLFAYQTMLHSASSLANAAVLKGGPFVNGTCDADRLCNREYLRGTTVTGRYPMNPLSPNLSDTGLERYARLLTEERANAAARALLYEDNLGEPISVMHNPIGRIRPDLGTKKRICTVEITGMPVNISASRQAAVLADFEFSLSLIENYFRKHGTDLAPMYDDQTLWALVAPLSTDNYQEQQDRSDRVGSDMILKTAAGTEMSLAEFYEMKRLYMHRHLVDLTHITPREIDDVYTSLNRMLSPPSGRVAQTIEQYIYDPACRSTGNWGEILRNGFVEEGGTPGSHNSDAVLRVANRVHNALCQRYS